MIELNETFSTTMIIEDVVIPNTWNITVNLMPNTAKNKLYKIDIVKVDETGEISLEQINLAESIAENLIFYDNVSPPILIYSEGREA